MSLRRAARLSLALLAAGTLAAGGANEACRSAQAPHGPGASCSAGAVGDEDEASLYQIRKPSGGKSKGGKGQPHPKKPAHPPKPAHAPPTPPPPAVAPFAVAPFTVAPPAAAPSSEVPRGPRSNPPDWGPNVYVFTPESVGIEELVSAAYGLNGGPKEHGQFSDKRFAFLFAPGKYDVELPVGYYTTVAGLGASPRDVVFTSEKGVYCREANSDFTVGALDTFWRSAENFRTKATWSAWNGAPEGMLWAASQATPLRRVSVDKNLVIFQYETGDAAGYASGGFLADSKIGGSVEAGSQQQYFSRNNAMSSWSGGVWNIVSVGSTGAPADQCDPSKSVVSAPKTPKMAEKPYVSMDPDGSGRFQLRVPALREASQGPSWLAADALDDRVIDFSSVYVAHAEQDTAESINAALADADTQAVVFAPGIYELGVPLRVARAGVVLLGLGFATLVATSGNVLIDVDGGVGGIHVAALLLQAGPQASPALLHWGPGSPSEPGFLHDIFARVGGPDTEEVQVDTMVLVEGDNVIGDDFWLWRADHNVEGLTHPDANPAQHGLVVSGDGVQMYGLAVEHTLQDLTLWKGEDGATFFYQAELPYGVQQSTFGDGGYAGYTVADRVARHHALGVGVYSYFRDHKVTAQSGIRAPASLTSSFVQPLSVFLNGHGSIEHIINGLGAAVNASHHVSILCP